MLKNKNSTNLKIGRREFVEGMSLTVTSLLIPRFMQANESSHVLEPEIERPNILFIMADDMGYGDPRCYNSQSKIPTPNIDLLAQQGVRFTNAHSPGTTCVPARYGLLTGRYPFRVKSANVREQSLIEKGRITIGSLLQKNGYRTACIGKWHLGFEGWKRETTNYQQPISGGPVEHGFDYFFGMHASLDIPPYFYIENDNYLNAPTDTIEANQSDDTNLRPVQGAFWRAGRIAPDFTHDEVLEKFTLKAIDWMEEHQKSSNDKPFFLYLALAAPHTPWLPTDRFRGLSKAGEYGDFVAQVDNAVGRILQTLKKHKLVENTLVFFTSDNGPVWFMEDVKRFDHSSTSFLRGMKADAWEGGHRMPFIARWPGKIKSDTTCDEIICFTDMLATFAAILGVNLPKNAGEDSFNILPTLLGDKSKEMIREAIVIEDRAIIRDNWKLILKNGEGFVSRRWSTRQKSIDSDQAEGELYNLKIDPGEQKNLYKEKPEIVKTLSEFLEKYKREGRSAPILRN